MGRRRRLSLLTLPLLSTLLLGSVPAAQAMVPYVYIPREKELAGAGLGIAQAASRLLRLGQAEDASRLAELTVRLLPDNPQSWVLLAEAHLRNSKTDKALYALSRAKQLDPNNPGIWFAEGALALRNSKPADAVGLLRKGLQLDPKNASAYFDLGNAQLLLGDPGAALGSFERASGLRKDFWEAINNQGLVLYEAGRTPEAVGRWRRVLKIKADVAETTLALATALHDGGEANRGEAVRLAEAALASDPNYVLDAFQKEQLWGPKLREAARRLLSLPELKAAVERANANASGTSDSEE